MIYLVVTNPVPADRRDRLIEACKRHAAESLALDEGCLLFDVALEGDDVVMIEQWRDEASLRNHSQRAATAPVLHEINTLRTGRSVRQFQSV
ncbi:MAG TPA: antibiotic biosynthesis monooxygenase [Candidatus Stercoripulliclostridium merdipullorum]|uniref:Antibiotic biosynthesis monooxygenase n=1 Tax=Candidatus Stercoripulliclostridium merdipullorum TaxID=2840952 RepID=A0A9D1NDF0_9FIRM|nr:antibiotic biosynthesis monooxygenase [Candidatus Stercoripulliclostridium merdipullorum]